MLGKYWVPSREKLITSLETEFLRSSSRMGYDIIMDNMNLNPKELEFLEKWANQNGYQVEYKSFLDIPIEECIRRDRLRENSVGEKIIRDTYNKYIKPRQK